jgi:hypothetical protein
MKSAVFKLIIAAVSLTAFAVSAAAQTPLKVCPNPSAPCQSKHKSFEKYELSFVLPKTIKPNVDYMSQTFFAVILKTLEDADCDQGEYSSAVEKLRVAAQKLFPDRKAFAQQQCPDMGAVAYTINGKSDATIFIAVYAGETKLEADQVLAKAKAKYSTAKVVKMQVDFQRIEQ